MPESAAEGVSPEVAFEVLHYNQQLIQFADSKAGNLIVVNSLFIAAAQAGAGPEAMPVQVLGIGLVLWAGLAIFACLAVIVSRAELPKLPHKDLIFFADIAHRRGLRPFLEEFSATPKQRFYDDIIRRIYVSALIARRKFSLYHWAQGLTVVTAVLWFLTSLAKFLPA